MNFGAALVHNARAYADRPAIVTTDRVLTYRTLNARANRLANGLLAHGLRPGDSVAVLTHNTPEAIEAYWATAKAGLVMIPVNVMLKRQDLERIFEVASVRACLVEGGLEHQLPARSTGKVRLTVGPDARGADSYESFLGAAADGEPDVDTRPDDICTVMFSSGTTARPKGIVSTHRARGLSCLFYIVEFGLTAESTALHATPLYHNSVLIVTLPALMAGGTVVLLRRFSPEEVMRRCAQHSVTHTLLVPTQLNMILASGTATREAFRSVRCLVCTGEPLPEATRERVLDALTPNLYSMYGISEGLATVLHPADQRRQPGSAGTPILHTEIRIVSERGDPLPPGEVGEIVGRSARQMTGYYDDPELTAATLREGWIHTGDLGRIGTGGYLTVVGRKKEMIISGGVNVYPQDIEQAVAGHPDLVEVAAVGVPDPVWGEAVKLVAVPRPGSPLTPDGLAAWCRERLPGYQRPKHIEFRPSLPRNAAGKILKQELAGPPSTPPTAQEAHE